MSMSLASLLRPFDTLRQSLHASRKPASSPAKDEHARDDAERLERIAVYARAGYFNMGYTLEMFHVIGEVAPE
ncbi:hypothetical protein V4C53_16785 [Paraburkholderia azotifigens]|uniref:hypothetical protein n=1 Tax=Paraburkholderia azotifigens TaxID=2057004 RepID=UPI0031713B73